MTHSRLAWLASLLLPVTAAVAACSSGHGNNGFTTGTGAGGSGTSSGMAGGVTLSSSGSTSSGGGGDAGPSYLIYASTDTTMFTLDPSSANLTLTTVGTYDCIGPSGTPGQQSTAMTDLAVDKNQNVWGLSSYAVRPLTVQGTTVSPSPCAAATSGALRSR